mgnify:CR=1 FL=1
MKKMTLHAAIIRILEENGNRWMDISEIADKVNRQNLYRRKDDEPLPSYQVHLRTMTAQYQHLFEKDGSLVRMKEQ